MMFVCEGRYMKVLIFAKDENNYVIFFKPLL